MQDLDHQACVGLYSSVYEQLKLSELPSPTLNPKVQAFYTPRGHRNLPQSVLEQLAAPSSRLLGLVTLVLMTAPCRNLPVENQ